MGSKSHKSETNVCNASLLYNVYVDECLERCIGDKGEGEGGRGGKSSIDSIRYDTRLLAENVQVAES